MLCPSCTRPFLPITHMAGCFRFRFRRAREQFVPICNYHLHMDKHNHNIKKKLGSKKRAKMCWANPMDLAMCDADSTVALNVAYGEGEIK